MTYLSQSPTPKTPEVSYDGNTLRMKGTLTPEDSADFFEKIRGAIDQNHTDEIFFDLFFIYINTSSTRRLFLMLKDLENHPDYKDIEVLWRYEEDDIDMKEAGEIYSSMFKTIRFHYKAMASTDND